MRTSHNWTDEEISYLRENSSRKSLMDMGMELGLSPSLIRKGIMKFGLPRYKSVHNKYHWSEDDLSYLRDHYETTPIMDIAEHLGIRYESVRMKAKELGLSRSVRCFSSVRFRYVKNYKHGWYRNIGVPLKERISLVD